MLQISVEVQSSLALFERVFHYLDLPHDIVDRRARPLTLARRGARPVRAAPRLVPLRRAGGADLRPAPRRRRQRCLTVARMDARRRLPRDRARPARRARRPERRRQDDDLLPDPAPLRHVRGSVALDGHRPARADAATLAGAIGMVTQETYLFHATMRANLLYARPEATQEEIEAATPRRISTTGSSSSRTATTRSSASAATACPAARSSAWRSPA